MKTDDDGRDEDGRWKKGHCPNPNGRPRKAPQRSATPTSTTSRTRW
jgi:hypothetical protein